jgi:hypothetical protein
MRYSLTLALVLLTMFFLTSCSTPVEAPLLASPEAGVDEPRLTGTEPRPTGTEPPALIGDSGWSMAVQQDAQGAVTVLIQPLNLDAPGETLNFEVTLDTHSVDLSMDLSVLAFLAASNGREVAALDWDALPGGHHVAGVLSFPATIDGSPFLAGADQLTLVIKDLAVPERRFDWSLAGP